MMSLRAWYPVLKLVKSPVGGLFLPIYQAGAARIIKLTKHNSMPGEIRTLFFVLVLLISAAPAEAQVDTVRATDEGEELESRVNYSAEDSVVAMPGQSRVILYGNARVEYEGMNMEAEYLDINYATSIVKAYGTTDSTGKKTGLPTFKDNEQTMEADTIKYNLKTKKGKIYNALTQQGELLVIGSEIKKDSNDVTYFRNMRCLPCQEADARTAFIATKAKVIPNDKIVTGPMFLEVGGVPTPLGLPFGYFPNTKRQHNGILLPMFGNSPQQGYNLKQGGFYWGINEKTDMVVRGDIYTNGSWLLGVTNNYNVLYKSAGRTSVSYSEFNFGDRDIPYTKNPSAGFQRQRAYSVEWIHTQDNKSNPTVRFSADVNFRNNQMFNRLNAVNSGQYLQNQFQSNVAFTKTWKGASLSLNARHAQNALTRQMDITFPSLTFNVNRFFPFRRENVARQNIIDKIQVSYLLDARNTLSGRDSTIFRGNVGDSLRHGVRHSIPVSTNFSIFRYITATPGINLTSYMYTKTLKQDYISAADGGPTVRSRMVNGFAAGYDAIFNTGFSTQVFFDYLFRGGRVRQVRHLLIPTLTYSYRPDFGEEQYGFWRKVQTDSLGSFRRYSIFEKSLFGGPATGKQNALQLSLSNNIEAKVRQKTDTGITYRKVVAIQNISMDGRYNFAADSFRMSQVSVTARTILFKYFDVNAGAGFDPYRYDDIRGRVVEKYMFEYDGRLARLTDARFAVATSIGSNMLEAMRKVRQPPDQTNGAERGGGDKAATVGIIPWNLQVTYNLNLSNPDDRKLQPTQGLRITGDVAPTRYWRFGLTTNYDFALKTFAYTTVNIHRDLKCWEARIDWIPFGPKKSYSVGINLKTSMLSEFKIPRNRSWFDNQVQ
jgi:hypothetical protein